MGSIFGSALSSKLNAAFGGNRDCRGRPQGGYFFGCQVSVINEPARLEFIVCGPGQCGKAEEEVSPFHKQQPGNLILGADTETQAI